MKAFLFERIGPVSYVLVQSVLIGIPGKLPNDNDGAPIIYTVNIPTTVTGLVTYDDHMTLEERAGGNVQKTDLVGRLIPIVRHPMSDVTAWKTYNSQ